MCWVKIFQSKISLLIVAFALFSCGNTNLLSEFADTDEDNAIFIDIQLAINAGKFADAILLFDNLSAAYRAKREVVVLEASAYAGSCGLDFLDMTNLLTGLDTSTTRLYKHLMAGAPGATAAEISDCVQAEALMKQVGASASARTLDENILMVYISFLKIGKVLSFSADPDDDGEPTVGYDACNAGDLSEDHAKEVATGLGIAYNSLLAISGQSDLGSAQITEFANSCADLPPAMDICNITDKDSMTADQVKGSRSLIQEDERIGIGSCAVSNDLTLCVCP